MRYFFNIADGRRVHDEVGQELPNHEAARAHAAATLAKLLQQNPLVIWEGCDLRVEVTDERGLILFEVVVYGANASVGGDA